MTREEFKSLVRPGMAVDQVKAAVGVPDKTSDNGDVVNWTYYDRTVDTVTGKTDSVTIVTFLNGVVESIIF